MRSFAVLLVVVLNLTCPSVSNVVTIPLTKLQRTGTYLKGSPHADRARAAFFRTYDACDGPATVPATNLEYVQYATSVGIGNPPTYYNLAVDTGSSNTFCGTGIPYNRTSTSIPTGELVEVIYGSGYFSGLEYLDQVTLAANLVITNQSIGDALSYDDFDNVDGIIGVGPVDLTNGTLEADANGTIPTVMNNLVSQGLVERQVLGVYFAPSTNGNDTNGAITYGGIDPSLNVSEVKYVPLTKTFPSSRFWGINITSATFGNHTIIPRSTAGIVDTGSTLVLLADDFFSEYLAAIPGASLDPDTSLIQIPTSSVSFMKPLAFAIADDVFTLDVAAQLIPEEQNVAWGGVAGRRYGVVTNMGTFSRAGLDFIIGQKFLERYYSVYDADMGRVGFAETKYTFTMH